MAQTIDIKEIVKTVVDNGGQVFNNVAIRNVSISRSDDDSGVDYWATLTLRTPVSGMYAEGEADSRQYKEGRTNVIRMPAGVVVTCLMEALMDSDERAARRLVAFKPELVEDFYEQANNPRYVSWIAQLVSLAKINVIARKVQKGKAKSLFALNPVERVVENDSIWHDVYGLSDLDVDLCKEAYTALKEANASAKKTAAAASTNAILDVLQKYTANNRINAALE